MPVPRRRVLVLGGTAEARDLAQQARERWGDRVEVVLSLAGRTTLPPAAGMRVGGFGGVEGLIAYLRREAIDALIDATHPFAQTMSHNARQAAEAGGVARLRLLRPEWAPVAGDRWMLVDGFAAAAAALAGLGRRVWLTFGDRLDAFAHLDGLWFLIRRIEPGAPPPLRHHAIVYGRPPFAFSDERALMLAYAIDVLVAKMSGGASTAAKLAAARSLALPVVMIRRPPAEPGPSVADVAGALSWLAATLDEVAAEKA